MLVHGSHLDLQCMSTLLIDWLSSFLVHLFLSAIAIQGNTQ